jgi:conjugative transposon TraM protein
MNKSKKCKKRCLCADGSDMRRLHVADFRAFGRRKSKRSANGGTSQTRPQSSIQNSARAYRDINRTLDNFYETSKNDPEKERLQQELWMNCVNGSTNRSGKKTALMSRWQSWNRSYQIASKYLPLNTANNNGAAFPGTIPTATPEAAENENGNSTDSSNISGKIPAVPVGHANTQTVSTLHRDTGNAAFIEAFCKLRNTGFITARAESQTAVRNTVTVCVHGDQTILNGQNVRLRLMEPVRAGKTAVPRNTPVSGTAKIQGERLDITVSSVEYAGQIIPVERTVYDLDRQRGIFIPDLQELNAAKEIVANMGTSAGTSFNINSDAGEQFVADMERNLIQGVSQFAAKKLREVKVHLKAGYRLYLVSEGLLKQSNNQQSANNP